MLHNPYLLKALKRGPDMGYFRGGAEKKFSPVVFSTATLVSPPTRCTKISTRRGLSQPLTPNGPPLDHKPT